jgi:HSP20 family molecular chaperone IbpA
MSQVQAQIDQLFQRTLAQMSPAIAQAKPGYSLSMDVRDLKDRYQVRAFLPDTKPADVKVTLKGDRLNVDMSKTVVEKPTVKNGETALSEWGNYEETVQLAGPLKDSQMKVERQPHELIITVPKA